MIQAARDFLIRVFFLPFSLCRRVSEVEGWLRRRASLARATSSPSDRVPLKKRLWAMRHGFYADRVLFYGLNKENLHDYLPDWVHDSLHPLNGRFSYMIDDKVHLPFLLKDFPQHAPAYLWLIYRSEMIDLMEDFRRTDAYRPEKLLSCLAARKRLIIKPFAQEGGSGVFRLDKDAGTIFFNGAPVDEKDALERLAGLEAHIVSEFVHQHEYAQDLYPSTTNTIRLVTMRDYGEHRAFIGAAFHRVGTLQSIPVDNLKRGGILCSIDMESGTIGNGLTWTPEKGVLRVEHHPDTGALLAGRAIPSWEYVRSTVLRMADRLAFLPYMGWDIVVTANGFKVLEINSLPTVLWQIHQPISENSRAREFYRRMLKNKDASARRRIIPDRPWAAGAGGGGSERRPLLP